ncbi:MAG: GntR family transcriptional regulator [Anaerolineae bacterium]
MIKRPPSLTEQVKALLKQRIINAEFDEGRIPSETDLASELGVSRTTIRDALSRLELEGTIFRKQGAGTFVNEASLQIHTRMEEIWHYEVMLEAHGYTPSNRIIDLSQQPAGSDIARALGIDPADSVVTVQKLFLADGEPVIFAVNHIPAQHITCDFGPDDFHQPVSQFLLDSCQQELAYYLSEIVPLLAPDWLGQLLHLPANTALISFEETGYNIDNEPILKATSYFRDDLVRLRLIRRNT